MLHLLINISQSLNTDSNWSIFKIWVSSLFNWVVIQIDDFVQISCDYSCDSDQLIEVKCFGFSIHKAWQGYRGKITDCYLLLGCKFYDFSA